MSTIMAVIGRGKSAGPNQSIAVEAGWNTPECTLEGFVLFKAAGTVKSLRIQTELKGTCETRWESSDPTKLATTGERSNYKVVKQKSVFQLNTDTAYESKEPLFPDPNGASIPVPFKSRLPYNDMPPSFDHPGGSVSYSLKVIATFYEGKNFTKSLVDMEVPITVKMPELAKLKLLRSPNPVDNFIVDSPIFCSYSLQLPKSVIEIGQEFEVNLVIASTPAFAKLLRFSAALHMVASFLPGKSSAGFNQPAKPKVGAALASFPRPVAEYSEPFSPVTIGGNGGVEPIVRRFTLFVDPDVAFASFGSQLITVKTIFKLLIFTDNSDQPNVDFETPVVLIPPPSGVPMSPALTASSASSSPITRSVTLPNQLYQPPMQSVTRMPSTPTSPSTQKGLLSSPPSYKEFPGSMTEIQRLREEQAKLSELLADIEKVERSRTEISMIRTASQSNSLFDGSSILASRSQSIDESVVSQGPAPDWTVEMVAEWVRQKGAYEEVVESFKQQAIDGSVLLTLTAEDLRDELKVSQLGVRRKILMGIEKLRG
ncbi:WD repeat, SAM and U-box domain-containing protein 1 [Rhizoclosmatium sp. JEL0117]|nr:WD repeat, SAM and U-box domain-containing protein 1 [Rhizoclosmatium sp. JEL0117]